MVGQLKNDLLESMPELFASKPDKDAQSKDKEKVELERKVGQLPIEVDFLKKRVQAVGDSLARAQPVDWNSQLSIRLTPVGGKRYPIVGNALRTSLICLLSKQCR